jgi:hypothetical protein
MRRLGFTGTSLLVLTALMAASVPARASHPQSLCIDAEPDQYHATSNDDVTDKLTVHRGISDGDHPPDSECHTEEGGGGDSMEIDFEITGAADPDSGDSPENPDLTCVIAEDVSQCRVTPPVSGGGQQTIAAWVDLDSDDGTVELDRAESQDEATSTGDVAEPDNSDLVTWQWSHYDLRRINSTITIDYEGDRFFGVVNSSRARCERRRPVALKRARSDRVTAEDRSDNSGQWGIRFVPEMGGRFYAVARRKVFSARTGEVMICVRARSRTIRARLGRHAG